MSRLPRISTSLVVLCLAATGCAGSASRPDGRNGPVEYASNATFTMAIGQDPGSFDPYRNPQIKPYYKLAYDSLVNELPNGKYATGLAEKWDVGADSATFTLRQDITCSDGTPLTAEQVAEDLTYAADPKNKSSLYGSQIPSVPFEATADNASRTVRIEMEKPFGFLLNTLGVAPIICAKGLRNPKMLTSASDGTGPFVLTRAVPGESYTFTVRKGYAWGPNGATTSAPGTPSTLVIRVIPNQTTAANLLLSGELNLARIDGEEQQRLSARGLPKVDHPLPGVWLWFNQLNGRATADKRLRQALVQALDLAKVVKISTGGLGSAAAGLEPGKPNPCPADNVSGRLPGHSLAAAESLLDASGWVKGADGKRTRNGKKLSLDMHFMASWSPFEKSTAEFIAQQWQALGIEVKTNADTDAKFGEVVYKTSSFDVLLTALGTSFPGAAVKYVSGAAPPDGNNFSGIDNETYGELVKKAEKLTPPQSCGYWNAAEQALFREVDLAPISVRNVPTFLHKAQVQTMTYSDPIPTSIRVLK